MPIIKRQLLDVVITCDPAISEKAKASRSALVCLGMAPSQHIFVLEVLAMKANDPSVLIAQMLGMAHKWQPRLIGIETVAYQKALLPFTQKAMQTTGQYWPIVELKPDRNEKKDQRIISMQPFFKSGQIHILRGELEFIKEYESFPKTMTKDILDAMAYGVRLLAPNFSDRKLEHDQSLIGLDPESKRFWRKMAMMAGEIDIDDDLWAPEMTSEEDGKGVEEFV